MARCTYSTSSFLRLHSAYPSYPFLRRNTGGQVRMFALGRLWAGVGRRTRRYTSQHHPDGVGGGPKGELLTHQLTQSLALMVLA